MRCGCPLNWNVVCATPFRRPKATAVSVLSIEACDARVDPRKEPG
jgi:hypothetical protein